MELITATVLHSITHYGWLSALNSTISFLSNEIKYLSVKLSLLSKALYAYKPGVSGIEVLLSQEQVSIILKQLGNVSSSTLQFESLDNSQFSAREILLITKAVTRIPANSSGLMEEGIEKVLGCLMERNDTKVNTIVASISWQIAATLSESADMNETEFKVETVTAEGK